MLFQDESDLLKEYEEIVIVEDNKPIDVDEEQGNLLRGTVNSSGAVRSVFYLCQTDLDNSFSVICFTNNILNR